MSALATAETPSRASTVQKVFSRAGIEAWLVEDYTVPLIALEFAFKGGAAQDPSGKPGAATLLAGLLDEGAGPYDSESFHRALDLLGLAVTQARLDPEPFERVLNQIAAGLRREANDPDFVAGRKFRAL